VLGFPGGLAREWTDSVEYSLHRQLKQLYAPAGAAQEVRLENFRIDVVADSLLVEIQHGSLAAIQRKVQRLLTQHRMLVVKPLVVGKRIVKLAGKNGRVLHSRASPKRGTALDAFHELIYFTRVFPHPRLELELVLVEIEEWRYPGHGRRRRWRRNDCVVEDQKLVQVVATHRLREAADLCRLVPCRLPDTFHTGHLAAALGIDRWVAQRIAYCWRQMGAVRVIGKAGNSLLYAVNDTATETRAAG
jgi:hypothetical protein